MARSLPPRSRWPIKSLSDRRGMRWGPPNFQPPSGSTTIRMIFHERNRHVQSELADAVVSAEADERWARSRPRRYGSCSGGPPRRINAATSSMPAATFVRCPTAAAPRANAPPPWYGGLAEGRLSFRRHPPHPPSPHSYDATLKASSRVAASRESHWQAYAVAEVHHPGTR